MARRRRCRRCRTVLRAESAYCPRCGTRQDSVPIWARDIPVSPASGQRAGWYRDPFGRQAWRYWDGEIWTERVFSGTYGEDVVAVDHSADDRLPEGAWRGSFGSLSLSVVGLAVAFGLSVLFILPFLLAGHPGGTLAGLVIS